MKTKTTNIIADLAARTFIHMSQEVNLSVEDTIKAVLAGGAARQRFDAFMELAVRTISN